jgi:hypothetical protein
MAAVIESFAAFTGSGADSHDVTLPSGIAAGDLLLMFVNAPSDDGVPFTEPTGWDLVAETETAIMGTVLFSRVADGGEGATATVGCEASCDLAAVTLRISGHDGFEAEAPGVGNSGSIDPPAITPTGGEQEYLFLAVCGFRGSGDLTDTPDNYTEVETAEDVGNIRTLVYERTLTATTEDPSTFDFTTNNAHSEWTVAVNPAAGGGGGRIMSSLAGAGGLAGHGGIAGPGGGLAG